MSKSTSFSVAAVYLRQLVSQLRRSSTSTSMKVLPRPDLITLSPDVERKLDGGEYKHKNHSGRHVINMVTMPARFRRAAVEMLAARPDSSSAATSRTTVVNFLRYLAARKPPVEDAELRRKAAEFEKDLLDQRLSQSSGESPTLERKDKGIILKRLKSQTYHWERIDYSWNKSLTYLYARAAPDFAVLTQIFGEIRARSRRDFAPKNLFDFGSGIGTSIWAANGIWENSVKEYFAVDVSSDMNDMARLLMQDGHNNGRPFIKATFFRQFLPATHALRYDIVVSAFSLMELPSRASRRQTLENLWNKTDEFLIIVETGSNAGYRLIMEARSYLIRRVAEPGSIKVFAPCNHILRCPRNKEGEIPCNFDVGYEPLFANSSSSSSTSGNKLTDKFSYVVLRKTTTTTDKFEEHECTENFPRIISEVLRRPRHVVCRICDSDGQLREAVVTATKHGRDLYKCARSCRWGDRLPALINRHSNDEMETGAQEMDEIGTPCDR